MITSFSFRGSDWSRQNLGVIATRGNRLTRPYLVPRLFMLLRVWRARISSIMTSSPTSAFQYNTLQPYTPPEWTKPIRHKPTSIVKLAVRPTPIHQWHLPGLPAGYKVWVKRDDMTGSTLSGNKTRKLEFLLAEALERGCDSVITCGGPQSNHARATAVAARQLGLQPHLMLQWKGDMPKHPDVLGSEGNLLLDRVVGAKISVTTSPVGPDYTTTTKLLNEMILKYAETLRSTGSTPYAIPLGGSNAVGSWGYIEAFQELMDDGVLEKFDDIVLPAGSGASVCGLAVANYLTGMKIKLHAVCAHGLPEDFYQFINDTLQVYGLTSDKDGKPLSSRDLVSIYTGMGYGKSAEEEQFEMVEIINKTGVTLDPVYTLKGVCGLLGELKNNPASFAGNRILYIHTGGIFGLYDGRVNHILKQIPATNQVSIDTHNVNED